MSYYRCLEQSIAALSDEDQQNLTTMAKTIPNRVWSRESGFLLKLTKINAEDTNRHILDEMSFLTAQCEMPFSKSLNDCLLYALGNGYQLIEFDTEIDPTDLIANKG
ncbi:hypothetical protein A1QO_03960 [Vibrio genomosp. F10 str. ZF-129]|uniref:Uncharacterized protein n=1 Tax=Vibrio genomosp. F10 str. ZF-129 TaxID=1187848 RepID=A0A1E5BIK1_9VIBR|nr:hypothetical protein [Vibrio genomosp. F10]OEE37266.1 hypothetical protein A1QO_03960 [Vibrio genomosp. F10 str. ZF-129]